MWHRGNAGSPRRGATAAAASVAAAVLIALGTIDCAGSAIQPGPTGRLEPQPPRASDSPRATPSPTATPLSTPVPSPTPQQTVPLVPVVSFWSTQRTIARADLALLVSGAKASAGPAYSKVVVDAPDAPALASTLGVTIGASVQVASPEEVKAAVRGSTSTIGVLRADDVTPDIRALGVGAVSLFGSGRLRDLGTWPLTVLAETPSTFDPGAAWVLDAGGDVNLERNVYTYAIAKKKGPDYPWSGGYAAIKSHVCCGFEKNLLVVGRRTTDPGAFRNLLKNADLALVNLEGPAPNDFTYHADGLSFSFDPALLIGLANSGIDGVSLANNHMRNAGSQGVLDTCANLNAVGIKHAGAGADTAAASTPAWFEAAGMRVAFLAYDSLQSGNFATSVRPGVAPYKLSHATADIRAARAAGADFVIVMPHWGAEYSEAVSVQQRRDAAALVAAGADLILGSHSHFTGPIEAINRPSGGPVFVDYSLGDLLFDLNYSESTQEGVVADLTYIGKRLVQVDLHPTLMVDHSQVNLLDPAGDGKRVLDRIRLASSKTFHW
jgi:poly-gamma-glutamate capsule biosynthesis protein CapA/YwtB (metallophosphatase superfamily)